MHGAWRHLIDEDFQAAYKHGIVVQCADGVMRRVYPRIFTYSADYPEKLVPGLWGHYMRYSYFSRVLLATIRHRGNSPCPRCLILKEKLNQMGTIQDMKNRLSQTRTYVMDKVRRAQEYIYNLAKTISGVDVEGLLYAQSWVPTIISLYSKFRSRSLYCSKP